MLRKPILGKDDAIELSELEYASKKKVTQRDRLLAVIEAVTPWIELGTVLEPFYSKGEGRRRPFFLG
jgi:IS5 family transposase